MSSSSSYGGSGASISLEESPINAVIDQIEAAFDPLPLDRAQVAQAQLSGSLRALNTELQNLRQQLAQVIPQQREQAKRAKSLGIKVKADLEWLDRHLGRIEDRAKSSYPIEYNEVREKVENPIISRNS